MQRRSRRMISFAAVLSVLVMLAPGLAQAASGDDVAPPAQPSAIERLVLQEDARAAEHARFEAIARQNDRWSKLAARERAMVAGPGSVSVVSPPAGGEAFAWGAALLGLGAGIALMCVVLGCVSLARGHARLRSV